MIRKTSKQKIEKNLFKKRIKLMFKDLSKGVVEVKPSELWNELNRVGLKRLEKHGYKNFKRTLGRQYFANVPFYLMNTQTLFLITHLNPIISLRCLIKSFLISKHYCFTYADSISLNFITYLVWEFTKKQDKEKILEQIEEPIIGNPPKIYLKKKLISQDVANSLLEYNSVFSKVEKDKIKTIIELGAGSGRDAYLFIKLLKKLKKYIIIDIPPALAISEKYLEEVFPNKKIFKYRDFNSFSEIEDEFNKSEILFFLPSQIELIPNNIVDLFVNISSLHEMRIEQIKYFFREIERLTKKDGYFYLKEFKNSYLRFDDVYIKVEDYPINNKIWKKVFFREAKIQTKFFEALLKKKI